MTTEREMTLKELVDKVPCASLAHIEYDTLVAEVERLRAPFELANKFHFRPDIAALQIERLEAEAAKWRELVVKLCKWFSEPGLANNAPTIWSGYTTKEKSIESECLLRECFAALGWPDPCPESEAK